MKTLLLLLALGGLLAGAIWIAVTSWPAPGEAELSVHMWIALGLGAGLSLAVGGGLMALVFFSARNGYDDIETRED